MVAKTKFTEIESTYRVYVKEWIFAYRDTDQEKASVWADQTFGGRVQPYDLRVLVDKDGSYVVQVHRWNLNSEWKTLELAEVWAKALNELAAKEISHCEIVPRNSKREHELTNYGTVLLPKSERGD